MKITVPSNGYEPIPEIEIKNSLELPQSPQERYPEANDDEAELLVSLDEIIKDPVVKVNLPSMKVDGIDISTTFGGFLCSLALPSCICLLMTGTATWIGTGCVPENLSNFVSYFPYAAALLGFMGSILPIQRRFQQQALVISSLMRSTRPLAISTVENVVISVASKIDLVNMRLNLVVDSMHRKFAKAAKAKKQLKSMDPNFEIVDPRSAERELEGAKNEIDKSIQFAEKDFPVTPWIPDALLLGKSQASTTLFLFLALHLGGVCIVLYYFPMTIYDAPFENTGFFKDFTSQIWRVLTFKNIKVEASKSFGDLSIMINAAWPSPLLVVAEVYGMVIIQLVLVFRMTNARATARIVNQVLRSVSEKTDLVLRQQGIVFLCQDILETRMGRVRSKLLKMISQLYKLEMLMGMPDINPSSPKKSPTAQTREKLSRFFRSSSPS